jgi:phosphohistidine phosphatase SixA
MKNIFYLLILIIISSCQTDKNPKRQLKIPEGKTPVETTYYLIRHAEKLRDNPQNNNPQLSEVGFERGKHWGDYFKDKELDLFYTTDYLRTFQTLIPIVYSYKGKIEFYTPKDSMFTNQFWETTYGSNTLIVGHSNTTPKFVNEIIGVEKYESIPDSINHRLYKVVIDDKGFIAKDTFVNVLMK